MPADQYRVNVQRPDDFDAFWESLLVEADQIPLEPELILLPERSDDDVDVFEIRYSSIDNLRIAGWYARPKANRIAGPYPGLLIVPGYISEPKIPKTWARMGYAAVGAAPRGKLRSNQHFNPGYPGLLTHNIIDRNTYSYRGFYIDAVRAIDFLQSRPEVDASRIGVHGSSQGGALTIAAAALRPDAVTCGAAGAPYLCGFMDAASLTHTYPYEEINEYLRTYPDLREQVTETVAYFDGLNMASRITCPMMIYLGGSDDVCPPETGYALRRALRHTEVEFVVSDRCAHEAGERQVTPLVKAFLAKHLSPAS